VKVNITITVQQKKLL